MIMMNLQPIGNDEYELFDENRFMKHIMDRKRAVIRYEPEVDLDGDLNDTSDEFYGEREIPIRVEVWSPDYTGLESMVGKVRDSIVINIPQDKAMACGYKHHVAGFDFDEFDDPEYEDRFIKKICDLAKEIALC